MLRLIDANLDRIGEGLRVLGEIARFILEDAELSNQLKALRHELVGAGYPLQKGLLFARKASEDVGAFAEAPGEGQREDVLAIVAANARRTQESLRVLEEFAKLPSLSSSLSWARFQQARFTLYELEQRLVSRLIRQEKAARLAGLHVVLDIQWLGNRDAVETARQVVRGGAKVVQLRDKRGSSASLLGLAREIQAACAEQGALFIINDYLDLALASGADGVHLGQEDLPVLEARRLLPVDRLIGCSASTLAEAQQAWRDGADYVGVGAVFPTSSKDDVRVVGLDILRQIKGAVPVPAIAIGGINTGNMGGVMEAGADGIAVISAVLEAADLEAAARYLASRIEKFKLSR